jgi:hypothetical protein
MASFLNKSVSVKCKKAKIETYDNSTSNALAFSALGQRYFLHFPVSICIFFGINFCGFCLFLRLLLRMLFSLARSL